MQIREPTPVDVEAVSRLYLASAEHHAGLDPSSYRVPDLDDVISHYTDVISKSETAVSFVADSDSEIAGLVEVRIADRPGAHSMLRPRVMATVDIVVAPDHRRKGVASALMEQAESWALSQGADYLMLDMLRANESAAAFYRALGFEDHGVLLVKANPLSREDSHPEPAPTDAPDP